MNKREAFFDIDEDSLDVMLKGKVGSFVTNYPDDARILGVFLVRKAGGERIRLLVESSELEVVIKPDPPPVIKFRILNGGEPVDIHP